MTSDFTPGDQPARTRIEQDLASTIFVEAGAGTGKTTALVSRIISIVTTGKATLDQIAAITFTEAAATELKDRIRVELKKSELAGNIAPGPSAQVDSSAICTLHSFAQRILREHWSRAGLPPSFAVMDAAESQAEFDRQWSAFLSELMADPENETTLARGFAAGVRTMDLYSIGRQVNSHLHLLGPSSPDLANPHLTPFGSADPPNPLNLEELIETLEHAASLAQHCNADDDILHSHLLETIASWASRLRSFSTLLHADGPASLDSEIDVLRSLTNAPAFAMRNRGKKDNWDIAVSDVRDACSQAQDARDQILRDAMGRALALFWSKLVLHERQSARMRQLAGRLSFDDLLLLARDLLRRDPQARAEISDRYRFVLIDEFQDTDPLQVEIVGAICSEPTVSESADSRSLHGVTKGKVFFVGDPKQSIYRFRGADISTYRSVSESVGETVFLDRNFRSVPGILQWVNSVFEDLFPSPDQPGARTSQAFHHSLFSTRDALSDVPPVTIFGEEHPAPIHQVRNRSASDASDAARCVIHQKWQIRDGEETREARWSDIAVLIPSRSSLRSFQYCFEAAGVPYRLEVSSLLWSCDEARDLLTVLKSIDRPNDPISVLGALRTAMLGCGDDDLLEWHQSGRLWDARRQSPPGVGPVAEGLNLIYKYHLLERQLEPSALLHQLTKELGCFELATANRRPRDHWERIRWFIDQARLYDEMTGGDLRGFLAWATAQQESDSSAQNLGPPDPDDDAVRVLTIHGAKGLEFPVVLVAGLESPSTAGSNPTILWDEHGLPQIHIRNFDTDGYDDALARDRAMQADEEIRLMYVAMTRARDHLMVSLHHKEKSTSLAKTIFDSVMAGSAPWQAGGYWKLDGLREQTDPVRAPVESDEQWIAARSRFEEEKNAILSRTETQPVRISTIEIEQAPRRHKRRLDRASALGVGRAVHQVLAILDLPSVLGDISDPADKPKILTELAAELAGRNGVAAHGDLVAGYVFNALSGEAVKLAQTHRHWKELFVAAPDNGPRTSSGPGIPTVEGYVDLVVQYNDSLIVVDYKTEPYDDEAEALLRAETHRGQLELYAAALESATGMRVGRCVLSFVSGTGPLELDLTLAQ